MNKQTSQNGSSPGSALHRGPDAVTRKLQQVGVPNIVFAGLCLGGLAGLYLLSLAAGLPEVAAGQPDKGKRIQASFKKLKDDAEGSNATARQMVESFYIDMRKRQIPIEDLTGSPFSKPRFKKPEPVRAPDAEEPRPTVSAYDEARRKALAAVRPLRLQSILAGGSGASAMIDGKLLKPGDRVVGWTVGSIEARSVTLVWRDLAYVLRLPE